MPHRQHCCTISIVQSQHEPSILPSDKPIWQQKIFNLNSKRKFIFQKTNNEWWWIMLKTLWRHKSHTSFRLPPHFSVATGNPQSCVAVSLWTTFVYLLCLVCLSVLNLAQKKTGRVVNYLMRCINIWPIRKVMFK